MSRDHADSAVSALLMAAEQPSGTPARGEHLRRGHIYATLALRDRVQELNGTLSALMMFAEAVYRDARADGVNVVPLKRERDRG